MTAFAPVRKVLSNHLIVVMATAFLTPSVLLFCAVHKSEGPVCPVFQRVPVKVCMDHGRLVSLAEEQINCSLDEMSGSSVGNMPQLVAIELNAENYWHWNDEYDRYSAFGSYDFFTDSLPSFLSLAWILAVAGYAIYGLTSLVKGVVNAHRS